jgi:prevent-host-death family protein
MTQKDVLEGDLSMTTKIMPISDLRRNASNVLSAVREEGDVVYITQHGRPAAVLVDYERYEAMLTQLEDLADLAALDAAVGEPERDYGDFLAEMSRGES